MNGTRPQRYDQCNDACTVDCGHCKGKGRPVVDQDPKAQAIKWMRAYRRNYPDHGPIRTARAFVAVHGTWTSLAVEDVTDAYYAAEEATR